MRCAHSWPVAQRCPPDLFLMRIFGMSVTTWKRREYTMTGAVLLEVHALHGDSLGHGAARVLAEGVLGERVGTARFSAIGTGRDPASRAALHVREACAARQAPADGVPLQEAVEAPRRPAGLAEPLGRRAAAVGTARFALIARARLVGRLRGRVQEVPAGAPLVARARLPVLCGCRWHRREDEGQQQRDAHQTGESQACVLHRAISPSSPVLVEDSRSAQRGRRERPAWGLG